MIVLGLMLQLGFGFALPKEGPLVPYAQCVRAALKQLSVEQLRQRQASGLVEAECGERRRAALPAAVEQAVNRSVPGSSLSRDDIVRLLPTIMELAVAAAVDDELRSRGIDPHPPSRLPSIPLPVDRN